MIGLVRLVALADFSDEDNPRYAELEIISAMKNAEYLNMYFTFELGFRAHIKYKNGQRVGSLWKNQVLVVPEPYVPKSSWYSASDHLIEAIKNWLA
jgi:hypothetical protein